MRLAITICGRCGARQGVERQGWARLGAVGRVWARLNTLLLASVEGSSLARRGLATARPGLEGQGLARLHPLPSVSVEGRSVVRRGNAWQVRDWSGTARSGMERLGAAWHDTSRLHPLPFANAEGRSVARSGKARQGVARQVSEWQGPAWLNTLPLL